MKRLLRGDVTLLAALLVALIVVGLRLARPEPGIGTEAVPHYTVESVSPSGLRAFGALLRARGYRTPSLNVRPRHWPVDSVVITAPATERFGEGAVWTKSDAADALEWVRSGGRMLVLCDDASELTRALKLELTASKSDAGRLTQPIPVLGAVGSLALSSDARFAEPAMRSLPLARAGDEPLAVARGEGSGLVIALSDPRMAANDHLGEKDNARFVAGLVDWLADGRRGRVAFDEWHQGAQGRHRFQDLVGAPGAAVAWQLVALIALWALASSRRFGRARSLGLRARTTGDYVSAVADLYKSVGATDAVREHLRERLVRSLPPGGPDVPAVRDLLAQLAAPLEGRRRAREQQLVALARKVDRLREEMGLRER